LLIITKSLGPINCFRLTNECIGLYQEFIAVAKIKGIEEGVQPRAMLKCLAYLFT